MASICSESLENKLISALKSDNLWIEFLQSIGEDMDLMRKNISLIKFHFDIENNLEDGLIRIAKTYGYTPNLIIDNSLQMIKKEVESIPYRIRSKTTYDGYYIIFKQISKLGDIYNYYWTGKKLVKAIKWNEIIVCLNNTEDYSEPFLCIPPDKNFSTISTSDAIHLDTGVNLDDLRGQWNWQLDENIEISPTKHLGIEYYPRSFDDFSDDPQFLLLKKYFQYLQIGVEYNRRLPIVPHCGIQLTGINYEGGGNNYFNPNSDYTIPKIKLNSVLGFEYNKLFVELETFHLDGSLGLDELTKWYLDKDVSTIARPNITEFKYISSGIGSLSTPSSKFNKVFDYSKLVFFYTMGDADNSYTVKDFSVNGNDCLIIGRDEIKGKTKKIKGIIGKSVDFDGITSLKMKNKIDIIKTELSFGFWFKPNSKDYFDQEIFQCLISSNSLSFAYSYKEKQAYYRFGDNIEGFLDIEPNSVHNIIFEVNPKNNLLQIYDNAEIISEEDISMTDYVGENKFYFGSDPIYHDNYIGILDNIWLINKLHTEEEIREIYNDKLGILTNMGDKLATYELDTQHESFENENWRIIQSHIKANDVTNEFGFFAEQSMSKEESLVNVFYDGKSIKSTMTDEPSSADKYSEFGTPLMQVYYLKTSITEYLYSTDKGEEKTYYHEFTYDSENDRVILSDPYMISRGHIVPTEYQYYSNVAYSRTSLINTTYKGKTNFYPIKNEFFSVFYKIYASNNVDEKLVELKASQDGKFYNRETNKNVTGFIDFKTGEYEIGSLTERYTTQEILKNSSILPEFSCILQGTPHLFNINNTSEIKKETFFMVYHIGDNEYVARDNGEGSLSGIGISNGVINYRTREISMHFDNLPKGDLIVNYTYLESLNMIEDTDVYFNYKVENEPISEIGLEDKNHNLLAYMTFPPIQFDTINNHISAMFVIRKQ